ncbi:S8 family serine peptidase [Bdellovibrionota bacterium FG-1]
MKLFQIIAIGLSFTLNFTTSATAGEVLLLKSVGSIRISDHSQELLKKAAIGFDQSSQHFVVQFGSVISEADQAALISQGLEIEHYLPEDALLVRGTGQAAALAKLTSANLTAVVPFAPEWKISPEFLLNSPSPRPEQILVSTLADTSTLNIAHEMEQISGVRVIWRNERDLLISASTTNLTPIARIEGVEWIQPAPILVSFIYPMTGENTPAHGNYALDITGYESGTKLMGFEAAWARGYHGEGQIAAVADTGLDSGNLATIHPDFKDTLLNGYLEGLGTTSWEDSMGHGTHVSGSVVGTGVASNQAFRGGAHAGKLLFEGLWSPILDNLAIGSDFNKLLGDVYKDGARVHSNSWGSSRGFGEYDTMAARMDEYMWNHPDFLVLFAAGNSGEDKNKDGRIDENSVSSPGTAKNVLTVGASENYLMEGGIQKTLKELRDGQKKWGVEPLASDRLSDNPNGMAAFSSRGPTNDGRIKPEIVAPGTNIVSTRSHHPKASVLWGAYNDDYAYAGGTSMATPLTAGSATVLRQYLVQARGFSNPSAALVKATLMHTATDLYPGQYGTGPTQELPTRRPNVHEGYGRVNMDAATAIPTDTLLIDNSPGVGAGQAQSVQIQVPAGGSLRATLSYTDAPAAASASRSLVNDLDLIIQGPNHQIFQKQDRINNTEMLELSGLSAGLYTVSVSGINVPQGKNSKQPYALVVGAGLSGL